MTDMDDYIFIDNKKVKVKRVLSNWDKAIKFAKNLIENGAIKITISNGCKYLVHVEK